MEALKDAESGKAQTMKGDNLDEFVDIPDDLELREGVSVVAWQRSRLQLILAYHSRQEVLKLPPTPTSVGDDEGDTDEEAQRIIYEHRYHQSMIPPVAASGLGYEEIDPAEAREWEQHDEMLRQMIRDEDLEKKQRDENVKEEGLSHVTQRLSMDSKEDRHDAEEVEREKVHLT